MKILLGTYTKKTSKGIYQIELDTKQERLTDLELVAETKNPTYLDFDPETKRLYSVVQNENEGGVAVWDYNGNTATLLSTQTAAGSPPCYVRYDAENGYIYDANYHLGKVTVYGDGLVERIIQYKEGSHAHFIDKDPKTGDLFVCDLGLDTVHKYRLLNEIATYHTAEGMGPRHIAFHPEKPILYIFGELNNTIDVVLDEEFDLVHQQTVSTLPEEGLQSSGAAIRISPDGKFLYASNRGHDSIVVFKIDEKGNLEKIQTISTEGEHPRDFAISPDGRYVVVANMTTNNLTLYRKDLQNGMLEVIQSDVEAHEPVCVRFI